MRSLLAVIAVSIVTLAPAPAFQGFDWQTAAPESQGMSSAALDDLQARLSRSGTKALLVIRNDRIVREWYAEGHSATAKHYTASMAKALVGGLSVAVALTDTTLALDDRVATFVPQWKSDPRKSRITLRHLGSHTSGIADAEEGGGQHVPHDKLTGWKGDFWKRLQPPNDPFTISRDLAPITFEPGETFQYSNPGIAMLTYAVTSTLAGTPTKDVRTLLRDRVMRPIGVADSDWSIGYNATYTVDGLPHVAAWGGGSYTARATARVGRLMLRQGNWDGTQVLSRDSVRLVTTDAGTPGHGAIGWWSNRDGKYPGLPRDAFWGSGAGHQVVFVIPSLNLVAVRNGATLGDAMEHHDTLNASLFGPLVAAIDGAPKASATGRTPPYPSSPIVRGIDWAPVESIQRDAEGSDNWPTTWGDDDALYAAYGDGNGFTPRTAEKLSMGFAKITGAPPRFTGVNIRTASGEARGDGQKGRKASGLLMVDGVLYLWARNAGNSQLAWSSDRGATWAWSDWRFSTSFGCPTFLNFGRNYAGARDGFVYVYSHDSDSAYVAADRMVLARVPSRRIRERGAYEFLKAVDAGHRPVWTRDIAERGAVFSHPGRAYRSSVTYNAGLRRYLWTQTLPGTDARFQGGFGVYDAPEPWGPWTTVFFTELWDVGPGETSSFPAKWMSEDGRTIHLVFSGDDAFSVRRATLRGNGDTHRVP